MSDEEDSEAAAEGGVGEVLGPASAEPAAEREAEGHEHRELQVDGTGFPVLPEREDADGEEQGCEGGSLGLALGHPVDAERGRG